MFIRRYLPFLFCFLFFGLHTPVLAGSHLDSLEAKLKDQSIADTERIKCLINVSWLVRDKDSKRVVTLLDEARILSIRNKWEWGLASALMNLGVYYDEHEVYDKALDYYNQSIEIYTRSNNLKGLGSAYLNLGSMYLSKGDYDNALDVNLKSLHIREKLNDSYAIASSLGNIGSIYLELNKLDQALDYFNNALALHEKTQTKTGMATMCNNIGNIYKARNKPEEALTYYEKALGYRNEIKDERGAGNALINMGSIYTDMKRVPESNECLGKALIIFSKLGAKYQQGVIHANLSLNDAYSGNKSSAYEEIKEALDLINQTGMKGAVEEVLKMASQVYSVCGDYKQAYEFEKRFAELRDSLLNEKTGKQVAEMQTRFETEKKESQIRVQNVELAGKETQIRKQNIITGLVGLGLVLVAALAFFIFRSYSQKKKANEELHVAYDLIEDKNKMVEEKNKEILDSIFYAQRIQGALLASEHLLKKNLPDYFVYYRPKDIVSGDFYWGAQTGKQFLLCTADCTGHGVPGAFMSLLNISFLNETIAEQKVVRPDLILNKVRADIIRTLNPEGQISEGRDGMDCSLCLYDFEKMELSFACANNELWLIRNGEIQEFLPDKMPVGIHSGPAKDFNLQKVLLQKGDTIYTFTDGYADQFGGPKGKKFKYKQLQKLILDNSGNSLAQQKRVLDETIAEWKGGLEQIDDILIIAVRI